MSRLRFCAAALFAVLAAGDAHAQFPILRSWPDVSPPCNGTLQACIDAALPDDTVEVATNAEIDESLHLTDSLALVAAPGFQPVLAAGRNILATSPDSDRYFLIEGFTLAGGSIALRNVLAGALGATVRNNRCRSIDVFSESGGPLFFSITGNQVAPAFGQPFGIGVEAEDAYGDGEIARNTVTMPSTNDASGIRVLVEFGSMDVDVVANRVTGSLYEIGIEVLKTGFTQSFRARVVNNLVTGATAFGWGIVVDGLGGDGVPDAELLNNTVAGNWNGINLNQFDGLVANNVVTGSSSLGYAVHTGGATVVDRNNLAFDNGDDFFGFEPGPGTVLEDPRYGPGPDYRPSSRGPVVDAGDDASLPAEFGTDLAGNPRRNGAVDLGAYEVPEPAGALAACAALGALAMLARLRSRAGLG